jgi:lysozyme family protein
MNEFLWALAIILQIEGGWTEIDGGTNYGITAATLKRANEREIVWTQDVRHISKQEAAAIYYKMYWQPSRAGRYPYPLNLVIFDAAVHASPGKAKELLHAAIRNTSSLTPRGIARQYVIERYRHLQTLKNFPKYRKGWRRRMQIIMNHVNSRQRKISRVLIHAKAA